MGDQGRRPSFPARVAAIKARVPLSGVVGRWVKLHRTQKGDHNGLCPFHIEKNPSFTVCDPKGFYHCFTCGAHGDVVDFVAEYMGITSVEAVERLEQEHGLEGLSTPADAYIRKMAKEYEAAEERRRSLAMVLLDQSVPGAGTLAETYMREARAVDFLEWPEALRFIPSSLHIDTGTGERTRWPVMIAAIHGPDDQVIGCHRTYLRPDGSGKAPVRPAKSMLGGHMGGAIRLTPARPRMGIGEGIESCATVLADMQRQGDGIGVWVAGSKGNVVGGGDRSRPGAENPSRPGQRLPSEWPDMDRPGVVLPPLVREVILLADNDAKDAAAYLCEVRRAYRRWVAEGRTARVAWPDAGMDFNDMAMAARKASPGAAASAGGE